MGFGLVVCRAGREADQLAWSPTSTNRSCEIDIPKTDKRALTVNAKGASS